MDKFSSVSEPNKVSPLLWLHVLYQHLYSTQQPLCWFRKGQGFKPLTHEPTCPVLAKLLLKRSHPNQQLQRGNTGSPLPGRHWHSDRDFQVRQLNLPVFPSPTPLPHLWNENLNAYLADYAKYSLSVWNRGLWQIFLEWTNKYWIDYLVKFHYL